MEPSAVARCTSGILRRIIVGLGVTTAFLFGTAAPAFAGAPNYVCQFGALRIAADVQRDAALLQEAPDRVVRRLEVAGYGSGGSGFTAVRLRERYAVRLRGAGGGKLLRGARSELVQTTAAGTRVRRGVCTAITGDHRAGWIVKPGAPVRNAPRANAAAATGTDALPFVWSRGSAPPGWVAVTLWTAVGSHSVGFLPQSVVRFA